MKREEYKFIFSEIFDLNLNDDSHISVSFSMKHNHDIISIIHENTIINMDVNKLMKYINEKYENVLVIHYLYDTMEYSLFQKDINSKFQDYDPLRCFYNFLSFNGGVPGYYIEKYLDSYEDLTSTNLETR